MSTSQARFATCYTPKPRSRLARFGAAILGHDCHEGRQVTQLKIDGIEPAAKDVSMARTAWRAGRRVA